MTNHDESTAHFGDMAECDHWNDELAGDVSAIKWGAGLALAVVALILIVPVLKGMM